MTLEINGIKEYLGIIAKHGEVTKLRNGWRYGTLHEFLLEHGEAFEPAVLGSEVREVPIGVLGGCYKNAFEVCVEDPQMFTYCEGYAVADKVPLPLAHAWTVTPQGNVIDPTWKNGRSYWGVKIPLWYVMRVIARAKTWGVLDKFEIGFPVLSGEHAWPLVREEVKF